MIDPIMIIYLFIGVAILADKSLLWIVMVLAALVCGAVGYMVKRSGEN